MNKDSNSVHLNNQEICSVQKDDKSLKNESQDLNKSNGKFIKNKVVDLDCVSHASRDINQNIIRRTPIIDDNSRNEFTRKLKNSFSAKTLPNQAKINIIIIIGNHNQFHMFSSFIFVLIYVYLLFYDSITIPINIAREPAINPTI